MCRTRSSLSYRALAVTHVRPGGRLFGMSSAAQNDLDWGERLVFDEDGEPLSPEARKLMGLGPLSSPAGKRWVEVLDVELDYLALVDAYLARNEHGHLSNAGAWWSKRVEFLEKLFGFSLEEAGDSRRDSVAWQLRSAAHSAIDMHARISAPFVLHMEGVPHPLVRGIEDRHRPAFKNIDEELRRACREVVAEVVRALDPEIIGRRVRETQLFDLGLDGWKPDELLEGW